MIRATAFALLGALLITGCGDSDSEPAATGETATATTASTTTAPTTTAEADAADGAPEDGGQAEADVSRPATIEGTIEAVLTGTADPALICDQLATADYVRTAYGAREGCIAAQRPGALADSVEVEGISRSAEAANALAIPNGGPYDGVEVEVELVRDAGGWQVESLLADVPAGP